MSSPKFMVLKLRDLKLPGIMLLVAIAAFAYLMLNDNGTATETFAPSDSYEDGTYVASIMLSDAEMDLIVNVEDHMISSVALDGFDEKERVVYEELTYGISFINDYVTSTQSLELPDTGNISYSTSLLMDAVRVALSDDSNATVKTTYQTPLLENLSAEELEVSEPAAEVAVDPTAESVVEDETAVDSTTEDETAEVSSSVATEEVTDEPIKSEEVKTEN